MSKRGFSVGIGTAALFGVLGLLSGDIAGYSSLVNPVGEINIEALLLGPEDIIKLSLGLDAYEFTAGNQRVEELDEYGEIKLNPDGTVKYKVDPSKSLGLSFAIKNNHEIAFSYLEGMKLTEPTDAYIGAVYEKNEEGEYVLDENGNKIQVDVQTAPYTIIDEQAPVIGIKTTIFLEVEFGKITDAGVLGYEGYDLNKEPLTSLLEGIDMLKDIVIAILLEIAQDQKVRFEIVALGNLVLNDLRSSKAQLTINMITGVGTTKKSRLIRVNLINDNLFIDLSQLNLPKILIPYFFPLVFGGEEHQIDFNWATVLFGELGEFFATEEETETEPSGAGPSNAGPSNAGATYRTPIDIGLAEQLVLGGLTTYGLVITARKMAFDGILGMLNMGELDIFSELIARIYMAPKYNSIILGVGLETYAKLSTDQAGQNSKVMALGVGLDSIRVNFERWTAEASDPDDIMIQPTSAGYITLDDFNTVLFDLQLKIKAGTDEGIIQLDDLFNALLDPDGVIYGLIEPKLEDLSALDSVFPPSSQLLSALPTVIALGDLGDTLAIDVSLTANVKNGLMEFWQSLQVKLSIVSEKAPEKFSIHMYLADDPEQPEWKNIYVDLESLGIEKLVARHVADIFKFVSAGGKEGYYDEDGTTTGQYAPPSILELDDETNTIELIGPDGRPYSVSQDRLDEDFAEAFPLWGRLFNAPGDAEKLTGVIRLMLGDEEGFLIQITAQMIFAVLGIFDIPVDIAAFMKGVLDPNVGVGINPNGEFGVDINLDSATSRANILSPDGEDVLYSITENSGLIKVTEGLGDELVVVAQIDTPNYTPSGIVLVDTVVDILQGKHAIGTEDNPTIINADTSDEIRFYADEIGDWFFANSGGTLIAKLPKAQRARINLG